VTLSEERAWDKVSDLEDEVKKLEEQIEQLVYLHNEDVSTIKLLNEQIKKMKLCANCKYHNKFVESKCGECEDYSKWEIKEND